MLRNIRMIAVIGCGGIGSWLLPPLLRFLNAEHFAGEIHLWDGDHFSAANSERQEFDPGALGLPKAEALVEHFKLLFPALRLREHTVYVTDKNIHEALGESTLVISCVDNHPARALVERRAVQLRDCYVMSAGNDRYDGNVHVLLRAAGKSLTVPNLERHPEIATARGGDRATLGCEELVAQGETQLLVTNLARSGRVFYEWKRFVIIESPAFPCYLGTYAGWQAPGTRGPNHQNVRNHPELEDLGVEI